MLDKHKVREIGGIKIYEPEFEEPYWEEVDGVFANQLCLEEGVARYNISESVACKLRSGGWVLFIYSDEQGFSCFHVYVPKEEKATLHQIEQLIPIIEKEYKDICKPEED